MLYQVVRVPEEALPLLDALDGVVERLPALELVALEHLFLLSTDLFAAPLGDLVGDLPE